MFIMKPVFNLKYLASEFFIKNQRVIYRYASSKITSSNEETTNVFSIEDDIDEEEIKAREAAIEKKRNKSELHPSDYNKQHNRPPYEKPQWELHESLKYRRRLYGKYGKLSEVDPSILWPSKTELDYMKEYEEIAYPFTFKTLIEKMKEKKTLDEEKQQREEAEILEKVKNVKYELLEFHKRFSAKKEKALELIEKKNKLIEKVRKEIGYKIDIRDPKFKEMFDKFQKEERKKLKIEKKARKSEAVLQLENDKEKTNSTDAGEKLENETFK